MLVRISGAGDIFEIDQLLGCLTRRTISTVLVPGMALRISFPELQTALEEDRELQKDIFQMLGTRTAELEQMSVCNRIHSLEQRLARHLLLLSDMTAAANLPVTQEELAQHLGVSRSSVVVAAGILRDHGLIYFRRGTVVVTDGNQLEKTACECYRTLRNLRQRLPISQAA